MCEDENGDENGSGRSRRLQDRCAVTLTRRAGFVNALRALLGATRCPFEAVLLHAGAMGYPVDVALRYLGSKKRAFISVGTAFAILGVTLGVAALATVMSVTGGFQAQFRDKVLGVNAHVLVLKYSTDFREYRTVMTQVAEWAEKRKKEGKPTVIGIAPFSINPMMLTHGDATATGVLLKGVDPATSLGVGAPPGTVPVLHLPDDIVAGDLAGLRLPGAKPPERHS